jgi:hypothetical protein
MLMLEPAAHYWAKQKIVKVVHQIIQAEQSGKSAPSGGFRAGEYLRQSFLWESVFKRQV